MNPHFSSSVIPCDPLPPPPPPPTFLLALLLLRHPLRTAWMTSMTTPPPTLRRAGHRRGNRVCDDPPSARSRQRDPPRAHGSTHLDSLQPLSISARQSTAPVTCASVSSRGLWYGICICGISLRYLFHIYPRACQHSSAGALTIYKAPDRLCARRRIDRAPGAGRLLTARAAESSQPKDRAVPHLF